MLSWEKSLIHFIDSLTHVVESVDVTKFDFSQIDMEQINELIKKASDKIGEK